MIITYFRSSSYNQWDMCPQSYFINYVLGWPDECINNKADKGTIVHKVLECLAKAKLAVQNGEETFEDDIVGIRSVDNYKSDVFVDVMFDECYKHYINNSNHYFSPTDRRDCRDWTYLVVGDTFDPRNLDIVCPEFQFDIPIEEDWAKYEYTHDGKIIQGQLAIKGTVDLVVKVAEDVYEVVDWKTGKKWDWGKDCEKTDETLRKDPQLMIYHLASRKLFPQISQCIMTINFVRFGGPCTFDYTDEDLKKTKEMLKRRFFEIKSCVMPRLKKSWKCTKLCTYGKNNYPGTDVTICEKIRQTMSKEGYENCVQQHTYPKFDVNYYEEPE